MSIYSNTAGATTPTPDTTPPSQPGTLSAAAVSQGEVDLAWGASTDDVGVTGYQVERCQGAGCANFTQIATPAGTSYKDTSVSPSTSYSYRVRATDAAGNLSTYSNTATALTPDTTPPSQPGTLTATAVSGGEVDLSWGGVHRQRRRQRLPGRALPGRELHQLRPDRDAQRASTYKDTSGHRGHELQLPRPRHRRRRQPEHLLEHGQRSHPNARTRTLAVAAGRR